MLQGPTSDGSEPLEGYTAEWFQDFFARFVVTPAQLRQLKWALPWPAAIRKVINAEIKRQTSAELLKDVRKTYSRYKQT